MKTNLGGLVVDMSNEEYHAHPAIGSTTLCRARRSWAHAMTPFEPSEAMKLGSAFHALVGEPQLFSRMFAKAPACDRRTTAGKQVYAAFLAENVGKTVLSDTEWNQMIGMLESILKNTTALQLLTGGVSESSYFALDKESGIPVKCRPDYYRNESMIVDIKTAVDASASKFTRSLTDYGRHIQTALYLDVVSAVTGKAHKDFLHLVIEKEAPYAIAIYALDDFSIDVGRREYKRLLASYAECQKVGEFPGYSQEIQTISLPDWALS